MTHKQLNSLFISNIFLSFFLSVISIHSPSSSHFPFPYLFSFIFSLVLSPLSSSLSSFLTFQSSSSCPSFSHTILSYSVSYFLLPFASFIILVASCRFPFLILGDVCLFIRPSVYLLWLICLSVSLSMHTRTYIFRHKRTLTHR